MSALNYLQTTLNNAVDHQNTKQVKELQDLAPHLFQSPDPTSIFITAPPLQLSTTTPNKFLATSATDSIASSGDNPIEMVDTDSGLGEIVDSSDVGFSRFSKDQLQAWIHYSRSQLFDELANFFPESMTQPRNNLVDLIPF